MTFIRRKMSGIRIIRGISASRAVSFYAGVQHSMYRGRPWTMRMFSGLGGPEETNQRFHYLLNHGETGLSVAFHYPTLMGYDSDSRSPGEKSENAVWRSIR